MAFELFPKREEVPEGHAFAEHRRLHPADDRLRRHGFEIAFRKRGQEPLWYRRLAGNGLARGEDGEPIEYPQSQAPAGIGHELKGVER